MIKWSIIASHWHEIQLIDKVCDNDTAPKYHEYNYLYKFELIYKLITHNGNNISK